MHNKCWCHAGLNHPLKILKRRKSGQCNVVRWLTSTELLPAVSVLAASCQRSPQKLQNWLMATGRDRNYWSCQVAKSTRSSSWSKLTRSPPSMFFYSQQNLTCIRVSHMNPRHFFKTKRDQSDFLLDCFVPYWLRSAKSWFHTAS